MRTCTKDLAHLNIIDEGVLLYEIPFPNWSRVSRPYVSICEVCKGLASQEEDPRLVLLIVSRLSNRQSSRLIWIVETFEILNRNFTQTSGILQTDSLD